MFIVKYENVYISLFVTVLKLNKNSVFFENQHRRQNVVLFLIRNEDLRRLAGFKCHLRIHTLNFCTL